MSQNSVESIWGLPLSYAYSKEELLSFRTSSADINLETLSALKPIYSADSLLPVNLDPTQLDDFEKALEGTGKWANSGFARGKGGGWKGGRGRGSKLSNSAETSIPFVSRGGKSDRWEGRKKFQDSKDENSPPLRASADSIAPPPGLNTVNWMYLDENGKVQGPFKPDTMNEWFSKNLLRLELMVKKTNQTDFYPLSSLVNENPHSPFSLSNFNNQGINNNNNQSSIVKPVIIKKDEITPEFAMLMGIDPASPIKTIPLNIGNPQVYPQASSFKSASGGYPIPNYAFPNAAVPYAQPIDPSMLFGYPQTNVAVPYVIPPAMDPNQLQQLHSMQAFQNMPGMQPFIPQHIPVPVPVQVQPPFLNQHDQSISPSFNNNVAPIPQPQPQPSPIFSQPQIPKVDAPKEKEEVKPPSEQPKPQAVQQSAAPTPSPSKATKSRKKKNKKAKNANSPARDFSTFNEPTFEKPSSPVISDPVLPPSSQPSQAVAKKSNPEPISNVQPNKISNPSPPIAQNVVSPAVDPVVSAKIIIDEDEFPELSSKKVPKTKKVAPPPAVSSAASASPWSNIVGKADSSSGDSKNNSNKINNNNKNNSNNNAKVDDQPVWASRSQSAPQSSSSVQDIQKEELKIKKQQQQISKQKKVEEEKKQAVAAASTIASAWSTAPLVIEQPKFSDIQKTEKIQTKAEKQAENELKRKQQQQLAIEESKKNSPWKIAPTSVSSSSSVKSLQEIQLEEKLQQEKKAQEIEQRQLMGSPSSPTAAPVNVSWSGKVASSRTKSLREIQEEELKSRTQKQAVSPVVGSVSGWGVKNAWNTNVAPSTPPSEEKSDSQSEEKKSDNVDDNSLQSASDLIWANPAANVNANVNANKKLGAWGNKLPSGSDNKDLKSSSEAVAPPSGNNDKDVEDDDDEFFWGNVPSLPNAAPNPTPSSNPPSVHKNNNAKSHNNNNNPPRNKNPAGRGKPQQKRK